MISTPDPSATNQSSFAEAYIANQERLKGYVYSLVFNWNDAEEVFQRTSLGLWKKWEQFDPEREFLPWAFGMARIEAKRFLAEKGKQELMLSDAAMEALDTALVDRADGWNERLAALEQCVKKLPTQQRSMLWASYKKASSVEQIGQMFGLSANAVYKRLRRIREQLHQCIDLRIAMGGDGK
ncbi:sigma-70 family RNA polymerase sigma factor [Blastopirellula sp. JC732]|uniref:Sigma-70 family RNA polymerase sigma factor n=1 Tax=Blastopirellula sediminis TaxID=2894196 RepID=A0A9X1MRG8_9BACT|nr:sigma-70 family RNA polymerase sigma factor [Blastopirellula sediminis]MCC9604683.1 sigma-70 family RNA polymerase sigma factor [Blastopirellula sediminis]MCC9632018.1 sigma-70 family RNA polymerase sigma factor [Blastopirellula sediminis]